jgi:putative hemolysin
MIVTRVNQFELRLVNGGPDLDAAQALRYQVFYEEMGARPSPSARVLGRDSDRYDDIADHLVVVDLERAGGAWRSPVVGCYRVLRESVASRHFGLYTSNEFDLSGVRAPYGEIMELGRSCVHADYRSGSVMQLLWRGIADYLDTHDVGLMLGCASLPGIDPDAVAPALSYLHHHHLAPAEYRPRALAHRRVDADRLSPDRYDARQVSRHLPPLLKAYLRIGGMIGDGAVVDEQFNTIDVCLVLPTLAVKQRSPRLFRQPQRASIAAAA